MTMSRQPSTKPTVNDLLQKLNQQSNPISPTAPSSDTDQAGEATWSLPQIVGMLRRKAIVIGICAIAMAGLSGLKNARSVPEFQGSFRLLVEPVSQRPDINDQLTESKSAPSNKEFDYSTQIEVLYSPKLMGEILKEVNDRYPGTTYDVISQKVSIIRLGETKIIEVSYSDSNPDKALLLLQRLARGYLEYSREDQQAQLKQGLKFVNQQLPKIQNRVNELQKQLETLRQTYNFVEIKDYSATLSGQIATWTQQRQEKQVEIVGLEARRRILQEKLGQTIALSQSGRYQALLQKYQLLEQQIAIESARFGPNSPNIQLLQRQAENLVPVMLKEAEQSVGEQLAVAENDLQIAIVKQQTINKVLNFLNAKYSQLPILSRQFSETQRDLTIATDSLTRFLQTQESLQVQAAKNDVPWQLISEPKNLKLKPGANPIKGMMSGAVIGIFIGIGVAFLIEKLENTYYTVDAMKRKVKLPILGIIPLHPDLKDGIPGMHIVDLRLPDTVDSQSLTEASTNLKNRMRDLLNRKANSQEAGSAQDDLAVQNSDRDSTRILNGTGAPNSLPSDRKALPLVELNLDLEEATKAETSASELALADPNNNYWLREYDAYGFMEAFRTLYCAMQQLGEGRLDNGLVISSALPTEGRTTIAVHLAQAAAALGKRVLLVDAHFRRGSTQIQSLLGLPSGPGLSDCLTGKATVTQVIQRLSWESSLFVIGAGEPPPDPTRLLASATMQDLMPRFHQSFDLVIYDMPPLMGLADVKLLAANTSGLVLITRLGKRGTADAMATTIDRLNSARIPILGVVANCATNYSVDLYA
ncbi:polysaccharide biosynthesis tyrosine autokinase [Alkalinema pantanalense CENA528]